MITALARELRSQLEKTVIKARDIAELAAREELQRLAVGDKKSPDYLSEEQRNLRRSLRAHGRQLGDYRKTEGAKNAGEQGIEHLVTEVAYEHWHRMLFARFLAENNLLMYKDGVTALAIQDCFDLAEEETGDSSNGWNYAANYAARMLPQIFRIDSPVFAINLAPNHQKQLEQLLSNLAQETFQASDSLGWVYQFWQAKRKEQINKSEVKIGADELPAVTQLFTEPYMVSFLLENSLGAWWKSKNKKVLDYLTFDYLRLNDDKNPAAGKFQSWPDTLENFRLLDPSCGSGHFLVAAFHMLVPMRMELESMDSLTAIDSVIKDNLHGLELDQRCIEIAVFSLALSAWTFPGAGGYRSLPDFNLACSGQSINGKKTEWQALSNNDIDLSNALERLYELYKDSPTLGSLINPQRILKTDLFNEDWDVISPLLNQILDSDNVEESELGVSAQGIRKASEILTKKYHLVVTNVPYLGRGRQNETLKIFSDLNFPLAKADLATTFASRCIEFCDAGGTVALVTPQNWLHIGPYRHYRHDYLTNYSWNLIAQLGSRAFETITGEIVNVNLTIITKALPNNEDEFFGIDVSTLPNAEVKSNSLMLFELVWCNQKDQLENPDFRISLEKRSNLPLLNGYANSYKGLATGDINMFIGLFWELGLTSNIWNYFQGSVDKSIIYGGRSQIVRWENGHGELFEFVAEKLGKNGVGAWLRGGEAWNKKGVAISQMSGLTCSIYSGDIFDENTAILIPNAESDLLSIFSYCNSEEYRQAVNSIDSSSLKIPNLTLIKVPFETERWLNFSEEHFLFSLPSQFSNDPTQWIFHGHPCGSVIWDEEKKWTAKGPLRVEDTTLQVAVARLLGYQWPTESDSAMELADEQREWVEQCKTLSGYVDDDGIVCLSAVRGEKPAHERLEELLQAAYGTAWSTHVRNQLLEQVSCKNKSLDLWLREKFFEQHCKLFQHRPFIWQLWDGLKDGFSVLVNYHKLDRKNLERLIYTYLDDWIRSQKLQQAEGIDGAAERLASAEGLKQRLELILEGEAPYDIFVRWKPLEQQPIGWDPDLNDGVRLNIRPFMTVTDVAQKGAGILRAKPNIKWTKDRGKDVVTAPWYKLGLEYGGSEGDRINDHHLSLAEKSAASGQG